MSIRYGFIGAGLCLAALTIGCAGGGATATESTTNQELQPTEAKTPTTDQKADEWGPQDDPKLFSDELEYTLADLPMDGEVANIPWTANYWPVYQDSINYKWNGADTSSPAGKYGEAFGVEGIEDKISEAYGIDHYASRTECSTNDDCDSKIGESCAKRDGEEKGRCIPTWWGICHAWAPASIMEAEPVNPVTRNGVEFKVNDIKALLTLLYNRTGSKFVSLRCNEDEQADEITYDLYDRPTGDDAECKDTNPGTYHVLLANYLGLKGESFVEDRTFDDEVWNQPLRGYRITTMEEVTGRKANALVGVQPEGDAPATTANMTGTLEKDAWFHAETSYPVGEGTTVVVTMKGTGDADLYVRFGSKPTADGYDCRPWLDATSNEKCELTVPAGATAMFVGVHGYIGPSDYDVTVNWGGDPLAGIPDAYKFNAKAAKLFYVKSEVDYIGESAANVDGNLSGSIDTYTHTDHYEYILEVDADGKVIGGEWLGASKKAHPDFLWLPTNRHNYPIAGGAINYDLVKSLLDESIAGPTDGGTEIVTMKDGGSVAKGAWAHFGPYNATDGAVTVVLSGSGDADLYVRKGSQPTAATYDCRPYKNGSAESCTVAGPGAFYVSVHGYTASEFTFTATFNVGETDGPVDPPPDTVAHLNESGDVAADELKHFAIAVTAGKEIVVRTQAANDVDLYVKMNQAPTTTAFDKRGYTYSGNETVTFTPTANGTLYIAVHGWEASSFTLTTADE